MGWSLAGAERMAKLRAYLFNKGDFNLLFATSEKAQSPIVAKLKRNNVISKTVNNSVDACAIPGISKISSAFARMIKNAIKNN